MPFLIDYAGKKGVDMCRNDVECFFIRMTAGPMDYTPGAMDNYPTARYSARCTSLRPPRIFFAWFFAPISQRMLPPTLMGADGRAEYLIK